MDTRVFRALHEIAVAVGGVLEPVELAKLVVEHARALLAVPAAGVYLLDEGTQRLVPIYSSDAREDGREPEPEREIPLGIGAAGQAIFSGGPVLVDDYAGWPFAGTWATERGVRSALAVPLQSGERLIGAVSVRTYIQRKWTDEDAQMLTLLAAQIGPAFEAARLYERMRTARQQAEAAITLRDEVLAGVSHDLAEPLARIRLYAELIEAEAPSVQPHASAEQLLAWSERIVAATLAMKSIMQELVDVARLQMGHALQLDLRRTDLVEMTRRMVGEQQAAGRPVNFETSVDELVGWWDEARLQRVIGNLLDNALKYSPPEASVAVSVELIVSSGVDCARVRVSDAGPGIPIDEQERVFERYYRASNVDVRTAGSGLGLAIARQIVEQHGGTIELFSSMGGGTQVSVTLPCSGPPESALE